MSASRCLVTDDDDHATTIGMIEMKIALGIQKRLARSPGYSALPCILTTRATNPSTTNRANKPLLRNGANFKFYSIYSPKKKSASGYLKGNTISSSLNQEAGSYSIHNVFHTHAAASWTQMVLLVTPAPPPKSACRMKSWNSFWRTSPSSSWQARTWLDAQQGAKLCKVKPQGSGAKDKPPRNLAGPQWGLQGAFFGMGFVAFQHLLCQQAYGAAYNWD